ncbi:MAG: hypothetical protein GY731_10260 [Gammaproteobacteria bacterium]|nr:hypothetical protein [Gammaproteobacteria bacterium]
MPNHTVTITDNATGKSTDLPVHYGTEGAACIDGRGMYKELGLLNFDPGYMVTASRRSGITYIDGRAGILMYRGYPIEQLAE